MDETGIVEGNLDEQIIDFAVFIEFLNETDSTIIGNQNFTEIKP